MSDTRHHSIRWGSDHRHASRKDRGYGFSKRRVGEAPSEHNRQTVIRPARKADRQLLKAITRGTADPEEAVFQYTGTKKPHIFYT